MDKKIAHIGKLQGKVLLFGGVYSNLQALEMLKSISEEEGIPPENALCTGDIVGYCSQPEETVQFFRFWGARSIQGNVEQQLCEGAEDCGCDFTVGSTCEGFSKIWYPYAQQRLSETSLSWMGELPDHIEFGYADKKVMMVHGSFAHISQFVFASTPISLKKENFRNTGSDIIIAGHSGLPFHQEIGSRLWLNPGVIGMPANDATTRVWYLILEEKNNRLTYTHRYLQYNYEETYQLMRNTLLPLEYAETLRTGLWHNMEILSEPERKLRGIPYTFEHTEKIHLK